MFFEEFKNQILLSINTSMPCRVVSSNGSRVTIQPLFKTKESGKEPHTAPIIEDVPVLWQRYNVHGGSVFKVDIPKGEHEHEDGEHIHEGGSHSHSGGSHSHSGSDHSHSGGSHSHDGGSHSHDGGIHKHEGGEHKHEEMQILETLSFSPVFYPGDVVLCVFTQRALDDALSGSPVYAGTSRILSIKDAVVVGIF